MTPEISNVVTLHGGERASDERPTPQLSEQSGPRIKIANGGTLPLGAWVRAGHHIAVVRGHYRASAFADLLFEYFSDGWQPVRTAASVGAEVRPLDEGT